MSSRPCRTSRAGLPSQFGLNGIDHQRQFEEQLRAVNRPGVYFFPEKIDDGLFVMRKEVKEGLATSLQTMYTLQMQTTIECPSVRDLMTARMTNFYFHLTEAYERLARIEEMQWAALEAEQDTAAPDGNK
eukprot:gnl/Chilomastix_cuspidata/1961.p1 GENE.gnl/Chilomastix_cuspidata/1961~~gnl/Chilomastix_cuspidata/1961.p1  ORF type:complete len:130 (+),score=31.46 gnl/Chilomastix_cuspidata/1961:124-513(+)